MPNDIILEVDEQSYNVDVDGDKSIDVEVDSSDIDVNVGVRSMEFDFAGDSDEIEMEVDVAIETVSGNHFDGPYQVTPKAHGGTVLETNGKYMDDDVTVTEIPYYETTATTGGTVLFIATEV